MNGVVVNENVGGQALPLYIEDAIQETTISTSGISAEYGRFGGGVVNVITKSGGNLFSGSFRDSLYNDNWRTLTPFAADTEDRQDRPDLRVHDWRPRPARPPLVLHRGPIPESTAGAGDQARQTFPYVRSDDSEALRGQAHLFAAGRPHRQGLVRRESRRSTTNDTFSST